MVHVQSLPTHLLLGDDLETSHFFRMECSKVIHISHVLRSNIHRLEILKPSEKVAQSDIQLAHGQVLADTGSGATTERDEALFACSHCAWVGPSCGIEGVWVWEGVRVAMHHPRAHRNGCSFGNEVTVESCTALGSDTGQSANDAIRESKRSLKSAKAIL